MNILFELNTLLSPILPVETGVFSDVPPDEYIVITPLSDIFELHADNHPHYEIQESRLSLFTKDNYIIRKNQVVKTLLNSDFTITDRRYIGYENDTKYHHVAIDCGKCYNYKLEE